jgi:hypothetical protein
MAIRTLAIAAIVSLATTAHGGTVLETTTRDTAQGTTTLTTTQVQGGKIHIQADDHEGFAVFRDDTLYVINTRDKDYVQLDRATIKAMADTINPALKQLQERMATMSPEQKAQIEQMLGGNLPQLDTPAPQQVRRTGRSGKVAQYTCNYVEIVEGSTVTDEFCVVTPSTLPGGEEVMAATTRMSQLMRDIFKDVDAPWLRQTVDRQLQNFDQLGGIPVATKHFDAGKPVNETTLTGVRQLALKEAVFEIPAGYKRRDVLSPQ